MMAIIAELGIYIKYIYYAMFPEEYNEEMSISIVEKSGVVKSKNLLRSSLSLDSSNQNLNKN